MLRLHGEQGLMVSRARVRQSHKASRSAAAPFRTLVIMAKTLCRIRDPKASEEERMRAGRRFWVAESEKGNGTMTTSKGLKVFIGLVIEFGVPLT